MRPNYTGEHSWLLLPLPEPGQPASLRRSNLIAIAILLFVTLGMLIVGFLPVNSRASANPESSQSVQTTPTRH